MRLKGRRDTENISVVGKGGDDGEGDEKEGCGGKLHGE